MSQLESKPAHSSPTAIGEASASASASPSIVRIPAPTPLVDVMAGCQRLEVKIHEHGFLALIDAMPRLVPQNADGSMGTGDFAIVQAARVSYGAGTKKVHEDRGLIRYLLRHRHTTPFEMLEFKFHVSMPIFVARQWIRHRTANVNEYSGRYSIMPDHFYRPTVEEVRKQSASNRQGGEETFVQGTQAQGHEGAERGTNTDGLLTAQEFVRFLEDSEALYQRYVALTEKGVSREMARIGLPVSVYTQWYWKCDLHNILRFLSLRLDAHAQKEIRIYAEAMLALLEPIVPVTIEAWRDYELESVRLTRLEVEALRRGLSAGAASIPPDALAIESTNTRERAEWDEKRKALGF